MRTIEIAPRTIVFTICFLLSLYIIWVVRELLYSMFIAFILMSALRPLVLYLEERKMPHKVSVSVVYLTFLLFFIFLISLILPPIIIETLQLVRTLPYVVQNLNISNPGIFQLEDITRYIPTATNEIIHVASGIFSNAFFVITTLFFGFYFLLEKDLIQNTLSRFFNSHRIGVVTEVLEKAEKKMSSWFWGELVLMTVVGFMTYLGLLLIGMEYAVPLAVLAGILEVVPNIGPILSAVPAFLIGISRSLTLGLSTIALGLIVQQLENNLIVPAIMRRAVGINPIITLMALIVGGKLGGVLGVLLAIPLYLFIETLYVELIRENKLGKIIH